jgi:heptosyltransferase-2
MTVDINNIVVRSPNWIGDFVLSVPAIKALRDGFAGAEITVVAHRRVACLAGMVEGVDRVMEFDANGVGRSLPGLIRFSRSISEGPIDLAVVLPLSFSSALMSFLSGARQRVGYNTELRGLLLTDSVSLPRDYRKQHLSLSYARLVAEVGVKEGRFSPRLKVLPECRTADSVLVESGLDEGERVIGIAPYATYGPAKRWPIENFLELAEKVWRGCGVRTLLFGTEDDRESDTGIPVGSDWLVDVRGRLTLPQAAYVLRKCACLVSNDTGVGHVASAVGTPVVSVFGSTSPEWTAPLGDENKVVYEQVKCSPCFDRICKFGHYECLRGISCATVSRAVRSVLDE